MRLLLTSLLFIAAVSAFPWDSEEEDTRSGGTTCPCGWTNQGRIVGGKEAPRNGYPLIVALQDPRGSQFCGGTIISQWHVLTAAHCTADSRPSDIIVNVGAHFLGAQSGGLHRVASIVNHERYDDKRIINDIAVIVTERSIQFNQNVGPACMPTGRTNLVGQQIRALGWGKTTDGGRPSNVLREVDLRVISHADCLRTWQSSGMGLLPQQDTNLCTLDNRKDTCQGDSGGPLIWLDPATNRFTLVALVSYGGACGGTQAAPNTDVGAFASWVNGVVSRTKPGTQTCRRA